MPDKHTVRLVSPSTHDQLVMKSILGILQRACQNWTYADDNTGAEVVIVDVDKDFPDITTLQKNHRCRVIVSFSETSRYVPDMKFSLSKPIRAKDLMVLLNEIENTLSAQPASTLSTKVEAKWPADSVQKTFTSTKIIDQLLNAAKEYKDATVEINLGNQLLYLDNRRKKVFASGPLIVSQFQGSVACRTIDKVPMTALESLTFTDIFYELTLSQSSASLAKDLSASDEFGIKQWPNMSNSRHAASMIRTAAYFSKQKATISQAARDLALEINHIIGFLNAVHSQNLLVAYPAMAVSIAAPAPTNVAPPASKASEAMPAKPSSGLGGLFGRIRQKLGI